MSYTTVCETNTDFVYLHSVMLIKHPEQPKLVYDAIYHQLKLMSS